MSVDNTMRSFKRAYPFDSILVYKFRKGGACSVFGEELLDIDTNDGYTFRVYKLAESTGRYLNPDDIKVRAFPFVYETRAITNTQQRRDILANKLKRMFPNHYVNIFIFNDDYWSRQSNNTRGGTYFDKDYGSDVDIILS